MSGRLPSHGALPPGPVDEQRLVAYLGQVTRRLASIETDELRARAAASALSALTPADLVFVVGLLARRSRDDHRTAAALSAFSRALSRDLFDPEYIATALELARSRADRVAEALFAAGPALRHYDANEEPFVDRRMRGLPLGQRRALSRGGDIDQLLRLAHDQDPRVICNLLANPRFTEREAVIVAARRPTHAHVLEEVLRSRFGLSLRVRAAVAHNPYAPLTLATRAMAPLPATHLRALADDDKLADETRRHARALLHSRLPTPAERARAARPPAESPPELEDLFHRLDPDGEADDVSPADED